RAGVAVASLPPRAHGQRKGLLAAGPERLGETAIPEPADDLGTRVLAARLPHERAVAHLGEGGLEVFDVWRLVLADVGHEPARLAITGHAVGVGQDGLGPRECLACGYLDQVVV